MGTLKTTKNMIGIAGFLFFIASLIGISVWMLENQSAETIKTVWLINSIFTLLASIFLMIAGISAITKKSSD